MAALYNLYADFPFKTHPRTSKSAQKWRRYGQICNISQIWTYLLHFWADFNVLECVLKGKSAYKLYNAAIYNISDMGSHESDQGTYERRMIPTNASRLHNITDLLEIVRIYYLKYLVSCSSTKKLFTPPKKMMAHQ